MRTIQAQLTGRMEVLWFYCFTRFRRPRGPKPWPWPGQMVTSWGLN